VRDDYSHVRDKSTIFVEIHPRHSYTAGIAKGLPNSNPNPNPNPSVDGRKTWGSLYMYYGRGAWDHWNGDPPQ